MRIVSGSGKDKYEFKQLFEQHWERLYVQAFSILQNHADAQDVIQDLFVNLWNKRNEINISANLESYLLQSVRNRAITRLNSNNRRKRLASHFDSAEPEISYHLLEHKQRYSILQDNIDSLPPKMRQIADLHFIQGFNVKEIATLLSISAQTVRNQIRTAIRVLENKHAVLRNN